MRGRETGSPEHRKAADYVADQFTKAGVEPAGIAGFMQPVTFRSRKIVEEKSSLALVRRGKETPVVLGDEADLQHAHRPRAAGRGAAGVRRPRAGDSRSWTTTTSPAST